MSMTLGSYTTLHDTLNDGGCTREAVDTARSWVMANGTLVKHAMTSRWRWRLSWDVNAVQYADLAAAYAAAVPAVKTFKPPDSASYWDVVASGWQDETYNTSGGARYKVSFVVEETTA
jgi:hypothetical protein